MAELQGGSCVEAWAQALEAAIASDPATMVLVNDSIGSSGLTDIAARFPDRILNVGIAEQNLVSVAAGLAADGRTVFVSSAASFLTSRALEQIKIDVAYSRANVKLIGHSPGVSYGPLGPTHHAIEDLTWMSAIPEIAVVAPVGPSETGSAVTWAASTPGGVYLRIPRRVYGDSDSLPATFRFGQATVLNSGTDVAVLATGAAAGLAVSAARMLGREGIEAHVLSLSTVKPLDVDAILDAARRTGRIVTVEDGLVTGFGSAVSALLSGLCPTWVRRIGFRDRGPVADSDENILHSAGISVSGIATAARELCASTKSKRVM